MIHPILKNFRLETTLPYAEFYLNESRDVLLIRYLESTNIDLEKAELVHQIAAPYIKEGAIFGISDITNRYINVTRQARNCFKHTQLNKLKAAHVIVVKHLPTRLIANFYIKHNKPELPTKVFSSFIKAQEWLGNKSPKKVEILQKYH